MPRIAPEVAQHRLNINPEARPVKQRLRRFAPNQQKVIRDEVDRLIKARFIAEVKYPRWLLNVVLVKNPNGSWRMCIDYTDLNRAYPKDCYPLPRIDQLVDAIAGHERLMFLDAFSGYNQIRMATQDQEDTAFVTNRGAYCYKEMPFSLKNTSATYQRMVDKIFKHRLGRNMEVYVDNMIVKSRVTMTHLADLAETFQTLKRFNMHLNPVKCVFRVSSGKFLGFIIHQWVIDANLEKATSASPECEEAFEKLKACLAHLPQLASPKPGETLGLYLAASAQAISSVLVREKLQPYFQAHTIKVITDQPPRQTLSNFDTSSHMLDGRSSSANLTFSTPPGPPSKLSEAEYEALLHGLRLALELHVDDLEVFSDSQLVTGHVNRSCEARDPTMVSYLMEVKRLAYRFSHLSVARIPRARNERADALAKSTSTRISGLAPATESVETPTIMTHEVAKMNIPPNWIEEILRYKAGGKEPDDPIVARWLR
uniref:Uncharacterized protein n=1 Tax=Musa acuminata subsp. malaccensis TaxID=214687 RepID=A0A804KRD4_MUSAM|nr:PREDICTED: uncharacterized protein LOC103974012 [Musa acuminata subsp. malaccensis]